MHSSDEKLLQVMRRQDGATIKQLMAASGVTRTALRQRLGRLMREGMVQRQEIHQPRGRPAYIYQLTAQAERMFGTNQCDLAICLWEAFRGIEDHETRAEVLTRTCKNLIELYREQGNEGPSLKRLEGLRQILLQQGADIENLLADESFLLDQLDCLASIPAGPDDNICSLEKRIFAELLQSRHVQ